VLAASGVAATGTGAAMVSSETQDQHLDDAITLAYELLHASRMYPGLHWCVGVFKVAAGVETVIVSNDGAGYIPHGVYVPRSTRVLFADPELGTGFQAKYFGWVNPAATMVAYARNAVFTIRTPCFTPSPPPPTPAARPCFPPAAQAYCTIRIATPPVRPSSPRRRPRNSTKAKCTASP